MIIELKHQLQNKYEMKDLGKVKKYLGTDFLSSDQGVLLHQKPYALQLAKDYGQQGCTRVSTTLPE